MSTLRHLTAFTIFALIQTNLFAIPSPNEIVAISRTLDSYLNNGSQAGIQMAQEQADRPEYAEYTPGAQLTLQYLADDNSISEDDIQAECTENPFTWCMSNLSFFIHSYSVDNNRSTDDFEYYLNNFDDNYAFLKKQSSAEIIELVLALEKWKSKSDQWRNWIKNDCEPNNKLDPLFSGKRKGNWIASMTVDTVTLTDFTASRKQFKHRPKFNPGKVDIAAIKKYLSTITDPELQAAEKERAKVAIKLLQIAQKSINSYGYSGVVGQGRDKITGTITTATAKTLTVKKKNNTRVKRYWAAIPLEQYFEIIKTSKGTVENSLVTLAVTYDWFGEYEEALNIAKSAKLQSDKETYNKLLLGSQ